MSQNCGIPEVPRPRSNTGKMENNIYNIQYYVILLSVRSISHRLGFRTTSEYYTIRIKYSL